MHSLAWLMLATSLAGSDTSALPRAEDAFVGALARHSMTEAARALDAGFSWVDAEGQQRDRASYLTAARASDAFWISESHRAEFRSSAIVYGIVHWGSDSARFARFWVRRPRTGEWRILAEQDTRFSRGAAPVAHAAEDVARDAANFILMPSRLGARKADVVAAFRALQRAEHAGDADGFAQLTAAEFRVVGVEGQTADKTRRVEAIRAQSAPTPFPLVHDVDIQIFGDAAIMRAIQEPARAPSFRFLRVWVERDGRWQQAFNQQTRIGTGQAPAGDALTRGLARADSLIAAAVEQTIPGAVLVVSQNGRIVHERAFGWAELEDFQGRRLTNPRPMHTTTLFDLASVTKVMATTMSVMRLVSAGRIDVDAPVYRYLPDFRGVHLDSITVRHLLTHSAGLVQWQPLYYHASNKRETYDVIRQMPLQWGVGEGRHYSDLGFMLLGYIVEHMTHQPLDRFVADSLYAPLGLRSTTYLPKQHGFTDFAATEQGNGYEHHMVYDSTFGYRYRGDPTAWTGWRQYVLVGETNDGNAWYANNGVAGHAGLFSTAADLRVLLDLLLAHGRAGGRQLIDASVIDRFLTRDRYANFLGWMSPNGLPEGSFSHTGFTGTYVLGVPKYGLSIVLLTNRQNMGTDARGYFPDLAPLQLAVAQAIVAGADADARSVEAWHDALGVIGIFDGQRDVGRARPGAATYDPRNQSYTIAGSGQNMWADHDDFHFVWKRLTGNFILSTRARFLGPRGDPHRKIGWTIRSSLDAQSPHVTAALHGNGLTSLQYRRTAGAITEEEKSRDSLPNADAVVQLERRDGAYILSVAQFGDTLVSQTLSGVTLPDTVYVGLFVCAHNDAVVERAMFANVRVTIPAGPTLVAYHDYLGSNLEILDVASGNATIVHRYRGSFQAPNWTPDGKALIYVQEGKLYSFDIATGMESPINTGFATRNNNDHVLSFDGRMLGISNHAPEDSGASIVYTVPVTGGIPKRVTARGPSYLHGWSPDGRWLLFTGQRNGDFDVYKIPAAGGEEIRLTSTPGLDDGPEYSPDGRYIYFNSARTGRMQLWRMRPDGSEQQQVTNDGFNNWFPHLSPDGRWIAFISFPPPPEVAADDHPFYKHVLLRLMPTGGGPARVIAYLYGGQGTINVPSWSPDGKRLAFVSNTQMQP